MKKKNKGLFVGVLLCTIALISFGSTFFLYTSKKQGSKTQQEKITVVTSFFPMYIAALNVTEGVDAVELQNLSEPETGCLHDYQLTPQDMKLLSKADVFIINGGGIEEFLTEVADAYPELTIVDASDGLELPEDNAHGWMSVSLHEKQIDNMVAGLSLADEAHAESYRKNGDSYKKKLEKLREQIDELRGYASGESVVLLHDAFSFIADDLGLQVAYVLNLDEERQVSAGEVAEVISAVSEQNVRVTLAEDDYGKEMGDMLDAQTDATTIYLETLVRGAYDKDSYVNHMQANIDAMKKAFIRK